MNISHFCATASAAALVFLSCASPVQAANPWIKAETANFIVYTDTPESDARDYIGKLEAFNAVTTRLYTEIGDSELPDYRKTTLHYLQNLGDFLVVQPSASHGFYPAVACNRDDTQLYSVHSGDSPEKLEDYTRFDLSWLFYARANLQTIKYFSTRPPRWVDTGLAHYFMTVNVQNDRIILGQPFPEILRTDEGYKLVQRHLMPFDDFIKDDIKPSRSFDPNVYRFQSWLIVSYFMADGARRQKFADYLEAVASGEEALKAFHDKTGMHPDDFKAVFDEYMTKGPPQRVYSRSNETPPAITISPVVDAPKPLPLIASAMHTCPDDDYGQTLLGLSEDIAKKNPGDALAQDAWVTALVNFGNRTTQAPAAVPVLEARLKSNPADAEAQLLLGKYFYNLAHDGPKADQEANYARARKELGKAYKLNPTSAPTLYYYARAYENQPDYPNENVLNAISLAQSYSRNAYDFYEAELNTRAGNYKEALVFFEEDCKLCKGKYKEFYLGAKQALSDNRPRAEIVAIFEAYQLYLSHKVAD
jgi:hypothetical protein